MNPPLQPIKPGRPAGAVPPPFDPQALAALVNAMVAHTATHGQYPPVCHADPTWLATAMTLTSTLGKLLDACAREPVRM